MFTHVGSYRRQTSCILAWHDVTSKYEWDPKLPRRSRRLRTQVWLLPHSLRRALEGTGEKTEETVREGGDSTLGEGSRGSRTFHFSLFLPFEGFFGLFRRSPTETGGPFGCGLFTAKAFGVVSLQLKEGHEMGLAVVVTIERGVVAQTQGLVALTAPEACLVEYFPFG